MNSFILLITFLSTKKINIYVNTILYSYKKTFTLIHMYQLFKTNKYLPKLINECLN